MFAELVTEAGPLNDLPRAEAQMTDKKDYYKFEFGPLPFDIAPDTVLYARVYITRHGDSCFGMVPILGDSHPGMNAGERVKLGPWHIHIPRADVTEKKNDGSQNII